MSSYKRDENQSMASDEAAEAVSVVLKADSISVEIEVFNQTMDRVAQGFGTLATRLAPGIYQVSYRVGSSLEQRLISVKAGTPYTGELVHIEFPTVAPITKMGAVSDEHAKAVELLTKPTPDPAFNLGEIVIFLRRLSEKSPPIDDSALDSLTLHDSMMRRLRVRAIQHVALPGHMGNDLDLSAGTGWSAASASVEPGGYTLRVARPARELDKSLVEAAPQTPALVPGQDDASKGGIASLFPRAKALALSPFTSAKDPDPSLPDSSAAPDSVIELEPALTFDMSIWVEKGWQTIVFVPMRRYGPAPEYASVHMIRAEDEWNPDDPETQATALAVEAVLESLRHGRRAVSPELEQFLVSERFVNPMLAIVGAHSVLLGREVDWRLFDEALAHLRAHLPQHPDVVALAVIGQDARQADRSKSAGGYETVDVPPDIQAKISWPPMLLTGYQGLLKCDARWPTLGLIVEGSFAERAAAHVVLTGTWTTWDPLDPAEVPSAVAAAFVVATERNWAASVADKWFLKVLKFFGKKVAQRDWQRVMEMMPAENLASARIRQFLAEAVAKSDAPTAQTFLKDLDIQQVSYSTDLPRRVVESTVAAMNSRLSKLE